MISRAGSNDVPLFLTNSRSALFRIEAANATFAAEYAAALAITRPHRNPAALEVAGAVAVFAGADSPLSKCVGIRLGAGFDERSLDTIESFYRSHDAAPALELSPLSPDLLDALLAERGYVEEYRLMVMTRDLAGQVSGAIVSDIEIFDNPDPTLWAETVAAGFSGLSPELLLEIFTTDAAVPSVTRWLATVDGTTAGGGTMSIHDGVAHLFGTSVLPEYRRRGVQGELLRTRLGFARGAGCDLGTVVASPGSDSERNISRFGFEQGWVRRVMRVL